MGSPQSGTKKGDNLLDQATGGVSRGINDIGRGAELVAQGNISQGLQTYGEGVASTTSLGLSESVLPGAALRKARKQELDYQETVDAANARNAVVEDKKNQVANRLNEMTRLRQKSPGRQLTLLTSSLTPNSQNTGTLLTRGQRG